MWNYPSGPPLQRSRTLDLFCKLQGISSQVCMLMSLRAQVHFEELGVMAALLAWTLPLPVDDQRYEYPSALSSNPIRTHGAAFDVKRYRFLPDLPAEFERMPYDAAKSDIVRCGTCHGKSAAGWPSICSRLLFSPAVRRYALLYHHGGMYLDTDHGSVCHSNARRFGSAIG